MVFQQCAQQVNTLCDFKLGCESTDSILRQYLIKMQPNRNADVQVCRFSMVIYISLIMLHYFVVMKHRSRLFLCFELDTYRNWGTGSPVPLLCSEYNHLMCMSSAVCGILGCHSGVTECASLLVCDTAITTCKDTMSHPRRLASSALCLVLVWQKLCRTFQPVFI